MRNVAAILATLMMTGCGVAPTPAAIAPATAPATRHLMEVPAAKPAGMMVPLYTYPTHASWKALAAVKAAHPDVPVMAIVNPENGPATKVDASYAKGIAALRQAGVTVVGYVHTGYGLRATSLVKSDVQRWKALYPATDGIFFDEAAAPLAFKGHHAGLVADAKARGFGTVVGNFGTKPEAGSADAFDVAVTYETRGLPTAKRMNTGVERDRQAMLAYGVASYDAAAVAVLASRFGWLYVTNDGGNNPWDSLTRHADALLASLD